MTADIMAYTLHKQALFRLAYPDKDPEISEQFFSHWKQGICAMLRGILTRKGHETFALTLEYAIRWEHGNLTANPNGYDGLLVNGTTKNDRPVCNNWKSTGRCAYGNRCKYAHPNRFKSRMESPVSQHTAISASNVTAAASITAASEAKTMAKAARTKLDPKAPCKNCNGAHPWTSCTNPRIPCRICAGTDHMQFYCPKATCSRCGATGHKELVCTKNPQR